MAMEETAGIFVSAAPSDRTQFFLGLLFTAALNWADFYLDFWVVLQYACASP